MGPVDHSLPETRAVPLFFATQQNLERWDLKPKVLENLKERRLAEAIERGGHASAMAQSCRRLMSPKQRWTSTKQPDQQQLETCAGMWCKRSDL